MKRLKYRPGQMIVITGQYLFAAAPEFNETVVEVFDASLYTATAAGEAVYRQLAKRHKISMGDARAQYPNMQCKIVQPHT